MDKIIFQVVRVENGNTVIYGTFDLSRKTEAENYAKSIGGRVVEQNGQTQPMMEQVTQ